jgi:hypothetical protein
MPTNIQKHSVMIMKLVPEKPQADFERLSLMRLPFRLYMSTHTRKIDYESSQCRPPLAIVGGDSSNMEVEESMYLAVGQQIL